MKFLKVRVRPYVGKHFVVQSLKVSNPETIALLWPSHATFVQLGQTLIDIWLRRTFLKYSLFL